MFHHDYIMREIESLTRFLAKVLFHKEQETEEIIDEHGLVSGDGFFRHTLFQMLDQDKINEAENLLHEQLEQSPSSASLKIALDFYGRLGEMSDRELEQGGFSREEIAEGLEDVKKLFVNYEI